MKRQSGASVIAIVFAVAAAGAGAFAFVQYRELGHARSELAGTKANFDQANAALRTAKSDLEKVRKDFDELKASTDQLRADRDSAKSLLEAEKAHGERVRAELTLAQQQIAFLRSRAPSAAQFAPPMAISPQPAGIRVVPAPRPLGAGSPMQARPAPAPGR